MASMGVALSPVLIALALTLQGCFFSDYKPSVKIAIGQQCDEKADTISDDTGLKEVLGGASGCGALDQDRLEELNVKDCATVLHEMVHFSIGAECEMKTASDAAVQQDCVDFDKEKCPVAVSAAVEAFVPFEEADETGDSDPMADGTEVMLALTQECYASVKAKIEDESLDSLIEAACTPDPDKDGDDDGDDDDLHFYDDVTIQQENMDAMGVESSDCEEYIKEQIAEFGTTACVAAVALSADAPKNPEDVTYAFIQSEATAVVDAFFEEGKNPSKEMEDSLSVLDQAERLRLFAAVRKGRWAKIPRARFTSAIVVVSACSALVFAALLGVAWRFRAARRSMPHEAEPILEEQAQSTA